MLHRDRTHWMSESLHLKVARIPVIATWFRQLAKTSKELKPMPPRGLWTRIDDPALMAIGALFIWMLGMFMPSKLCSHTQLVLRTKWRVYHQGNSAQCTDSNLIISRSAQKDQLRIMSSSSHID